MKYNEARRYSAERVNNYTMFFDVNPIDKITVNSVTTAEYCGCMHTETTDYEVVKSKLILNYPQIANLADYYDIPFVQALDETLYHEWIHYIHAVCTPDNYDLMMCHEGELWDDMITIGIDMNFIKRKEI